MKILDFSSFQFPRGLWDLKSAFAQLGEIHVDESHHGIGNGRQSLTIDCKVKRNNVSGSNGGEPRNPPSNRCRMSIIFEHQAYSESNYEGLT